MPAARSGTGGLAAVGWLVLALVFVDEVAAVAAFGVWGWHIGGSTAMSVLLAVVLPVLAMAAWYLFASPKAPRGGPVARPLVKVLVFGTACLALWHAGHPGWALALLVFSVAVNAAAQLAFVRRLTAAGGPNTGP